MDVGSVSKIWRYPVKSMLGEEVESAEVVWSGFYGNRYYALVDAETSRLVSAKNPAKWARIFECRSKLLNARKAGRGTPSVELILPGGRRFLISDGHYNGAEQALSELFGRPVRFTAARPGQPSGPIEEYHADIDEDRDRGTTTEFVRSREAQPGTFTDMAAVHLVTTATLEALSELHPSGDFHPLRFRPDILVDTGAAKGFVETGWVGKTLALGDEVTMKVFKECGRCVMTTLWQGDLASDTEILGTAMRFNRGKVGVYASVVTGGKVRRSDRVAVA